MDVIRRFGPHVPILGVCLGHQAHRHRVRRRGRPRAAARCTARRRRSQHDGRGVFRGVAQPFAAGRYHSLVVAETAAADARGRRRGPRTARIMGVRHRALPVHGVQFHPESVLTGEGRPLLRNFLEYVMFAAAAREAAAARRTSPSDEAAAAMDEIMDGARAAGADRRPADRASR